MNAHIYIDHKVIQEMELSEMGRYILEIQNRESTRRVNTLNRYWNYSPTHLIQHYRPGLPSVFSSKSFASLILLAK